MKGNHPLERAKPRPRPVRARRAERMAKLHVMTREEDRLDLLRSLDWPSPLSRRLTQYLLLHLEHQTGAVLHAWWLALHHGRRKRRGCTWMDTAGEALGNLLGQVLERADHPQQQALLDQFPPQWNLYDPWMRLVDHLVDTQHPGAQAVILTLGSHTFPRTLNVSGYLPNEGSQKFIRFLMSRSDDQTQQHWMPMFLRCVHTKLERPRKLHPWQVHGFAVIFGRSITDVILERYEEQLEAMEDLDEALWLQVGQQIADMAQHFFHDEMNEKTCVAFMNRWLDAGGPWNQLRLPVDHPLHQTMANHPQLRKSALMSRLNTAQREEDNGRRAM